MRVLIITNNPNRASFRQRIGVYLDTFAAQGVSAEVALLPKGFLARRRLFRHATEFDGVFLHKKKLNRFDAQALRHCSKKIIYNFDDAIMYSDARPGRYSRAHAVPFQRTVRLADAVITGSAYLAEQAGPFNANVHVLPLGLNIQDYGVQPLPPADGTIRLVWIGSAKTLNYLDGIKSVLGRVVAGHDNVAVRIIGDTFPNWPGIPTEEIKWSPEARRVKLATSDIGLAPLPDDPFTQGKCSFKVLEYSASGLPAVASPVGTNVDHVLEGDTGFLAATEEEWVACLSRLIDDPALRVQMGQRGRSHAAEHDVSVIGKRSLISYGVAWKARREESVSGQEEFMSNRFGTLLKKMFLGKRSNLISLEDPFETMQRLLGHCQVTGMLDAGASDGRISKRLLRRFPAAQIFAFEPNPLYAERLKDYAKADPRFQPHYLALSDQKGQASLNVTASLGSTSLLTPGQRMQELMSEGVAVTNREDVEITTIDEWVQAHGNPSIELMKFDIQGAELKALSGAVRTLQTSTLLVYAEIWFNTGYEGGALYGEIDAFLHQHGYVLYDFYKPKYDSKGLLTWANAIFIHAQRVQG